MVFCQLSKPSLIATLWGSLCVRKLRLRKELNLLTITNLEVLEVGLIFIQQTWKKRKRKN